MFYTAGEAAKILRITASAIRYYDKEGLLPCLEKTSGGIRMFREEDLVSLRLIRCLKKAGLPLKEIRRFMNLPDDGEETIRTRLSILLRQKEVLQQKQKELDEMMNVVNYKIWYYATSQAEGTTRKVSSLSEGELPKEVRSGYAVLHTSSAADLLQSRR